MSDLERFNVKIRCDHCGWLESLYELSEHVPFAMRECIRRGHAVTMERV